MKHEHLKQIGSTQDFIKSLISDPKTFKPLLVSTDMQTKGKGRQESTWIHHDNSLAFSFTLRPHHIVTLTSLEIAVLLVKGLNSLTTQEIYLKWPNDIVNRNFEKLGGILLQMISPQQLVVGIGLNINNNIKNSDSQNGYQWNSIPINTSKFKQPKKEICYYLYQFILKNRLSSEEVQKQWNSLCQHINQKVTILDFDHKTIGQFMGIGKNGEALIKQEDIVKKVLTGSLRPF